MTIIKICSIPGCNRKHHAKGYCAEHYRKFVLVGHYENTKCSVDGCNKPISYHFSKDRLCEMHGTRLKRNGDVNVRQKERDTKSYAENIINSDSPLDYEIPNTNTFSEIARCYYGDYCHECGWNKGACEAHHILPKSQGGKNTLRNAVILCPNCHSLKHANRRNRFSKVRKLELIEILKNVK